MSQHLKQTLLKTAGQHATLTYHRPLGAFTGSVVSALMLSQLLYWHDEDDPWRAVRHEDWKDLLGRGAVTDYRLRECREDLQEQGIIETDLRHAGGAPTHHYRLRMDELMGQWRAFTSERPRDGSGAPPEEPSSEDDSEEDPTSDPAEADPDGAPLGELLATDPEDVTPEVAKAAWNAFANKMRDRGHKIPRIRKMTDARASWVRSKKGDLWPDMEELMTRIARSPHLRGENDRGWTVDFNWIWKYENNPVKVLEGNYDPQEGTSSASYGAPEPESGPESESYDSVGY